MENKQTKGRQKIEMKIIDDEEDRLISFSKRRSGIYKKASELSTLCGTEIGIMVFSPSGKAFTYGNPSLDSVANRYLNQNPPPNNSTAHLVEAHRRMRIYELNQQYNELVNQLEVEKKRGEMLKQMAKPKGQEAWWEMPVEELSEHELERLNAMVEELGRSVERRISDLRAEAVAETNSVVALTSSSSSSATIQAAPFPEMNPVGQLRPNYAFGSTSNDGAGPSNINDLNGCQMQGPSYGRGGY